MRRIAVISAVLDHPDEAMVPFNTTIAEYKHMVIGRMGLPMQEYDLAVITVTVKGTLDEINTLTGKIGKIHGVNVKTSISKKEIE